MSIPCIKHSLLLLVLSSLLACMSSEEKSVRETWKSADSVLARSDWVSFSDYLSYDTNTLIDSVVTAYNYYYTSSINPITYINDLYSSYYSIVHYIDPDSVYCDSINATIYIGSTSLHMLYENAHWKIDNTHLIRSITNQYLAGEATLSEYLTMKMQRPITVSNMTQSPITELRYQVYPDTTWSANVLESPLLDNSTYELAPVTNAEDPHLSISALDAEGYMYNYSNIHYPTKGNTLQIHLTPLIIVNETGTEITSIEVREQGSSAWEISSISLPLAIHATGTGKYQQYTLLDVMITDASGYIYTRQCSIGPLGCTLRIEPIYLKIYNNLSSTLTDIYSRNVASGDWTRIGGNASSGTMTSFRLMENCEISIRARDYERYTYTSNNISVTDQDVVWRVSPDQRDPVLGESPESPVPLGEWVEDSQFLDTQHFMIRVRSIDRGRSALQRIQDENRFFSPDRGYEYLIVKIAVQYPDDGYNEGSIDFGFYGRDIYHNGQLIDDELNLILNPRFGDISLMPGGEAWGYIYFEIPENWNSMMLMLGANMFTDTGGIYFEL